MNNGNGAAGRKALLAGAIGNFVEWYDFGLYGYFATTIAHLYFPKSSPSAALLSTFAIFGVGFLIRPLGGLALGHLGDKIGRRPVLVWSVMLMSAGTVATGLLPGYAQIGIAAPALLLLCRLVQGFSAAGEYTGASIFIVEHSPAGKRGQHASVGPAALYLGVAFGVLVSVTITSTTTAEQLTSWGWRVPFILAAPLALIGLYLRLRVEDSPVFAALQKEQHIESAPLMQALRVAKKPILVLIGWVMASSVGYYLIFTFLVSYLTTVAKFSNTESLVVALVIALIAAACCLLAGSVVERLGRKRIAVASALAVGVWAVPAFALFEHCSLLGASLIVGVFAVLFGFVNVTTTLAVVELFPARVRSSASGLAYNLAYAVFGGTAPYVATWLVGRGYFLGPGYYLAGVSAIAALAAAIGIGSRVQVASGRVMPAPIAGSKEASAELRY